MKKVNLFEKEVDNLVNNCEDSKQIEKVTNLYEESIRELVDSDLTPDSEDGQRFLKSKGILAGIGRRFVNLLTIEFKITFAGVTICYLRIPKLDENTEKRS